MYRVEAVNPAGSILSDWATGRTREGGMCVIPFLFKTRGEEKLFSPIACITLFSSAQITFSDSGKMYLAELLGNRCLRHFSEVPKMYFYRSPNMHRHIHMTR